MLFAASPAYGAREFDARFSQSLRGGMATAANTIITCQPAGTAAPGNVPCATAQTDGEPYNNAYPATFVDIDGDASTFNSSAATLTVPAAATVKWAGLYWGGHVLNAAYPDSRGGSAPTDTAIDSFKKVKLSTPAGAAYQAVTASTVDWAGSNNERTMQGFADVTTLVRAAGTGEYTVADIDVGENPPTTGGYAGWTLVVAYEDPTGLRRNVSVFDGLLRVAGTTKTVTIDGLQTPPTGTVDATMGVVAYEGDGGAAKDTWELRNNVAPAPATYTPISDALTPANNAFSGRITRDGAFVTDKNPNFTANSGYDSKLVNADGIIPAGATSATIKFGSFEAGETFMPGVVMSSIRLAEVEGVKSAINLTHPGVAPVAGDVLRYLVSFRNGEAATPAVTGVDITDEIPSLTTYQPGTLKVNGVARTDAAGDDAGEFADTPDRVVARVGTGASGASGGTLAGGASGTLSFEVKVSAAFGAGDTISNTAEAGYEVSPGVRVEVPSNEITETQVSGLPTVAITGPAASTELPVGGLKPVDFACAADGVRTVAACTGTVTPPSGPAVSIADGANVPTTVPGVYTITAKVTDDAGQTATTTRTYEVFGPPTAAITGPAAGKQLVVDETEELDISCAPFAGRTIASCTPVITGPGGPVQRPRGR